jgi:hypothetical protein
MTARSARYIRRSLRLASLLFLASGIILLGSHPARAIEPVAATDARLSAVIPCESLETEDFTAVPGAPASVTASKRVAASGDTPEYCDVTGFVQPQVGFELRLPLHDWNGRYFQVGCGGLCGIVNIQSCGDVLVRDFAVAADNMGHVGHFWKEPLWAGDPMLRRDFGSRATHVTAIAAKAIVTRLYGRQPAFSYFRGCSTGGREALAEAQHYPSDFNGIIAGDPAFAGRLGPFANNWDSRQLLRRDGSVVFPPAKLALLHAAVLAACDALDGLKDGIIDDPRACRFDVRTLACPAGEDRPDCLTAEQVVSARNIYDGVHDSHGTRLYPGHSMFGAEAGWDGERGRAIADAQLKYLTFPTEPPVGYTHWDFDFDRDAGKVEAAAALYDPVAPHQAPDLARFHALGGKLIVYHGWADPGVSPLGTLDYYAKVTARLGGLDKVRMWFRVFMVPGMRHCRGGDAPNEFDFMPPLMAWVEHAEAPAQVIATQVKDGAVYRTRPLAPYPQVARYDGAGDVDDARNWSIREPAQRYDDNIKWIWAP